jgi:hypothetical protein
VERRTVETTDQWKGGLWKLGISGKADCGNYGSVESRTVETADQWKGGLWKLRISGKADCGNYGSVERQTVETVDQWKSRLWKLWIILDRHDSCSSTEPHFIHGATASSGPQLLHYRGFTQAHYIQ